MYMINFTLVTNQIMSKSNYYFILLQLFLPFSFSTIYNFHARHMDCVLSTNHWYMFSHAWRRIHVLPPLLLTVTFFVLLGFAHCSSRMNYNVGPLFFYDFGFTRENENMPTLHSLPKTGTSLRELES